MTPVDEQSDDSETVAIESRLGEDQRVTGRANDFVATSDPAGSGGPSRSVDSVVSRRKYLRAVGAVMSLAALGGCSGTSTPGPGGPGGSNSRDASGWHGDWAGTATSSMYKIVSPFGEETITRYSAFDSYRHGSVTGTFGPPLQSELGAEGNPLTFQIAGLTPGLADGDFFLTSAIVLRRTIENPRTGIARFWECSLSDGSLSGVVPDDSSLRGVDGFNFVVETSPIGQYTSPLPYRMMGLSRMVANRSGNKLDIRVSPPQAGQRINSGLMAYAADIQIQLTRQ